MVVTLIQIMFILSPQYDKACRSATFAQLFYTQCAMGGGTAF